MATSAVDWRGFLVELGQIATLRELSGRSRSARKQYEEVEVLDESTLRAAADRSFTALLEYSHCVCVAAAPSTRRSRLPIKVGQVRGRSWYAISPPGNR